MDGYLAGYRTREHGSLTAEQEGLRLFQGLFDAPCEQRVLLLALMSAGRFAPVADDVSEPVRGAFAQVIQLFEEIVATESAERGFSDADLPAAVRVMFGMVLSVALHHDWMALPARPHDLDRTLAATTRMAMRGLGIS